MSEETKVDTPVNEGSTEEVAKTYANKYNSVDDLETGYNELQSNYSTKTAEYKKTMGGFIGSPEEGYALEEGVLGNGSIETWGKENGLSNDGYVSMVTAMNTAKEEADNAFITVQMGLLGANGTEPINNLIDVAKAQDIDTDVLDTMTTTAAGVEVLEQLFKGVTGTVADTSATGVSSADELKAMRFATDEFGRRKMSSSPEYRARVEKLEAESFSR